MNDKLFLGIVVFLLLMIYMDKFSKSKKKTPKMRHFDIPITSHTEDNNKSLNDDDNLAQHRKFKGINDEVNSIQSKWNSQIDLSSSISNSNMERENHQKPAIVRKKNEIVRNEGSWLSLNEQHSNNGKMFTDGYDEYLIRM